MFDPATVWRPTDAWSSLDLQSDALRGDRAPGVHLSLIGHVPMVTLIRARGEETRFAAAVAALWGIEPPGTGRVAANEAATLLWSGPDQWLAVPKSYDAAALRAAFADIAGISEQGDGRALVEIAGPSARDTLAKGIALDIHPRVFQPDCTAVTALSHLSVQLWQRDDVPTFVLCVPRTVAAHIWDWLTASAAEFGFDVMRRAAL